MRNGPGSQMSHTHPRVKKKWHWTPRAKALGDLLLIGFIMAMCVAILFIGYTIGQDQRCDWSRDNNANLAGCQ